jgi:hypothetical protein
VRTLICLRDLGRNCSCAANSCKAGGGQRPRSAGGAYRNGFGKRSSTRERHGTSVSRRKRCIASGALLSVVSARLLVRRGPVHFGVQPTLSSGHGVHT